MQPFGPDLRYSRHRYRIERAIADDPESAGSLPDQCVAIRQEGQRPRLLQPIRDDDQSEVPLFGRLQREWTRPKFRRRPDDRRGYSGAVSVAMGRAVGLESWTGVQSPGERQ